MAIKCVPWSRSNRAANDTGTHLKCFCWSTNQTNIKTRTDLSPRWLFRILRRSNRKTSVIPLQEEVSKQIEQSVPKDEYDRVLQEMNSLDDQLSRKDEEINMLRKQISEKREQVDLFQPGSFQSSNYETQTVQIVPKEECDRPLQERDSLNDQLSQKEEETRKLTQQISEKDEQLDILKNEVRGLKDDLEWLLLYWDVDPWIRRSVLGCLNNTKDKTREGFKNTEQQSLAVAGPQVASRYREKAGESDDKNRVKRVERDIFGATPTPTNLLSSSGTPTLLFSRSETPPKAATPTTDRLPTSYYIHAEIFRTLIRKGIIPPPFPRIPHDESRPIHQPLYHKGSSGHCNENLTLQADISSDKIEPPEAAVAQDNPSADKLPCLDENAGGLFLSIA